MDGDLPKANRSRMLAPDTRELTEDALPMPTQLAIAAGAQQVQEHAAFGKAGQARRSDSPSDRNQTPVDGEVEIVHKQLLRMRHGVGLVLPSRRTRLLAAFQSFLCRPNTGSRPGCFPALAGGPPALCSLLTKRCGALTRFFREGESEPGASCLAPGC